jgi:hypothetical protein
MPPKPLNIIVILEPDVHRVRAESDDVFVRREDDLTVNNARPVDDEIAHDRVGHRR